MGGDTVNGTGFVPEREYVQQTTAAAGNRPYT